MPSPSLAMDLPAFAVGLLFGSFLNVCIARLPHGESIVSPRSRCPRCRAPIRWFDNIPLLSWPLLGARCRACGDRISVQYPLVELAVGLWFLLAASRLAPTFRAVGPAPLPFDTIASAVLRSLAFATIGFLLIGLLVMDWRTQRLPNAFTWGGIASGVFLVCLQAVFLGESEGEIRLTSRPRISSPGSLGAHGNLFLTGPEALIFGRLLAIIAAAGVLLLVRWLYRRVRGREGLGLGDVKLLALTAAFLGFSPALLSLFLGVIAGGVYAVALLASGRATGQSRIPFGSFLGAGGLVAAAYAQPLLGWYKSLL